MPTATATTGRNRPLLDVVRLHNGSDGLYQVLDNSDWMEHDGSNCCLNCHFYSGTGNDCSAPRLFDGLEVACIHHADIRGIDDVIFRRCARDPNAPRSKPGRKWPKFLPD